MIKGKEISAIPGEKIFNDQLKVKRVGKEVYEVIGFHYGDEEVKYTGFSFEVAAFLNQYFGNGREEDEL